MSRTWFPVERRFVFSTWPERFGELFTKMTHMRTYLVCEVAPPRFDHVLQAGRSWKAPPQYDWGNKSREWGWLNPQYVMYRFIPSYFRCSSQSYCRVLERCWAVAVDHWHRVHDLQQIPIKPKHEQTLLIIAVTFRMMANISLQNLATSSKSFPIFVKVFQLPQPLNPLLLSEPPGTLFFLSPHPLPIFLRGTCWQIFVHSKVRPSSTSLIEAISWCQGQQMHERNKSVLEYMYTVCIYIYICVGELSLKHK